MDAVDLEIREAEDDDALRDLGLGQVDIAITQEYDGEPLARSDRFRYTTLVSDRLRLLAPPRFPTSVRLRDLTSSGWLVNGAHTRCARATERILGAAGIVPRITGQTADNRTLLALVSAGHGATIAPELVATESPGAITVASVDLQVRRTIHAVTRAAVRDEHDDVLHSLTSTREPRTRC